MKKTKLVLKVTIQRDEEIKQVSHTLEDYEIMLCVDRAWEIVDGYRCAGYRVIDVVTDLEVPNEDDSKSTL